MDHFFLKINLGFVQFRKKYVRSYHSLRVMMNIQLTETKISLNLFGNELRNQAVEWEGALSHLVSRSSRSSFSVSSCFRFLFRAQRSNMPVVLRPSSYKHFVLDRHRLVLVSPFCKATSCSVNYLSVWFIERFNKVNS